MLAPDLKGYFLPKLRAQPFNFSHVPLVGQHLFFCPDPDHHNPPANPTQVQSKDYHKTAVMIIKE
jgi:hypothetical protein